MNISIHGNFIENGCFEGRVAGLVPSEILSAFSLAIDYLSANFIRCALTGDITVLHPSNPSDGARLKLWLTASGANRNLSFDPLKEQVSTN